MPWAKPYETNLERAKRKSHSSHPKMEIIAELKSDKLRESSKGGYGRVSGNMKCKIYWFNKSLLITCCVMQSTN